MTVNEIYSVTAVYRHKRINLEAKDKQPVICVNREEVDKIVASVWKYEKKEDIMIDVYEAKGNSYYLRERLTYDSFKKTEQRLGDKANRLAYCEDNEVNNFKYTFR